MAPWYLIITFQVAQTVKHLSTMRETGVQSLGWVDPLEKEMAIHSRTIAGKSHGQRNMVGYSPWVTKSQTRPSDFTFTYFQELFLSFSFEISNSYQWWHDDIITLETKIIKKKKTVVATYKEKYRDCS